MSDISSLLQKTSRTFALTIPLLPQPTRDEVGVAYLLFRVVDTLEDSPLWRPGQRITALEQMREILTKNDREAARELAARCLREPPVARDDYMELMGEIDYVMEECARLRPAAAALVRQHAALTAAGMSSFVGRTDENGVLRLSSVRDLRDYCYVVAGVVGDMLTELFVLDRPALQPIAPYLRERARFFGEGLQVVNILKDANDDAKENRIYLPADVPRIEIFALARADLERASEYTQALHEGGAPRGVVAFNLLLIRLARDTLTVVRERGPGAKLSRTEVFAAVTEVSRSLDEGLPMPGLDREAALSAE
jgi:farnesyl-diphosphate farnesyltransferase